MASKFHPIGEPEMNGRFEVREERDASLRKVRFRLLATNGTTMMLTVDDLFDLTDLLNDVCDVVEEWEEAG